MTKGASHRVYRLTKGNFRQVNKLMDRCLYVAMLRNTVHITSTIVNKAQKDLISEKHLFVSKRVACGFEKIGQSQQLSAISTILLYIAVGVVTVTTTFAICVKLLPTP